jgi:uncharacterized protein (UPF0332 family)
VKPEAQDYLDKALEDLGDAEKIAGIFLAKVAARSTYYAAFHAAEAFIIERTGKVPKTHNGVRRNSLGCRKRRRAMRELC